MPAGSVAVVIVGAVPADSITILSALVSLPAVFVALTVKVNVPVAVGVPEITPPSLNVKPVGRLPLSSDHVIGVVPFAFNV